MSTVNELRTQRAKSWEKANAFLIAILLFIPTILPSIQNLGIEILRAKNMHKFRSIVYVLVAVLNIIISIPLCAWFGSVGVAIGTAIPVFSLRSEADFGVGDFYDIKKMVDWCAATGQKMLQILNTFLI